MSSISLAEEAEANAPNKKGHPRVAFLNTSTSLACYRRCEAGYLIQVVSKPDAEAERGRLAMYAFRGELSSFGSLGRRAQKPLKHAAVQRLRGQYATFAHLPDDKAL